jgi:hypothetical protein
MHAADHPRQSRSPQRDCLRAWRSAGPVMLAFKARKLLEPGGMEGAGSRACDSVSGRSGGLGGAAGREAGDLPPLHGACYACQKLQV